jgi:hypothetical protein
MTDYLDRACDHLGVDKGSVIKHRIQDDDYIVIVDNGIAGCPKYYIPLSQLSEPQASAPVAVDFSYRELQAIAKNVGIPANQSAGDLRAALWPEHPPVGVKLWSDEEE